MSPIKGDKMTKNIGPMERDSLPFAEITMNGNSLTHYIDTPIFSVVEKDNSCHQHLQENLASGVISQFIMEGCHFPNPSEEQIIRTAFVCPGPSILKKCRLRIIQADAKGNVLNEGKVKPQWL